MKENIIATLTAVALLAIGLSLNSCGSKNSKSQNSNGEELSGRISLSGAFALYPLAVKWAEEFQKQNPDVKIEIDGGGAGKGMTDALSGQVELGMVSREVKDEEVKKGAVAFAVAKDAVAPTINANNPLYATLIKHGITKEQAKAIWIDGTLKTWGQLLGTSDATPIAVFTRSDACGAAETWAAWAGKHQEDLKGEGVNGDPGVATAVGGAKNAIGFNNIGYAYDNTTLKPLKNIHVLPIDVNSNGKIEPEEDFYADKGQLAKAIAEGKYPSPPARDLYLVSNGVPTDPIVVAFLKYILSKGQNINASAGYIPIAKDRLQKELKKLSSK